MASRTSRHKAAGAGDPLSQFISDQADVLSGQRQPAKRSRRKAAPTEPPQTSPLEPIQKESPHDGPLDTFIAGGAEALAQRTGRSSPRRGSGRKAGAKSKPKEPAPDKPLADLIAGAADVLAMQPPARPKRTRKTAPDKDAPSSPAAPPSN